MILKAFREKSNKKYINELLNSRKAVFTNEKVKTIGVLLNLSEYDDFESFRTYFKSLELTSPKSKVIAFVVDEKKVENHWDLHFTPKDFGWKGKVNNIDLQTFIDMQFDVLISYYKSNIMELNLVTTLSKANFKVGISNTDKRMYDLIIDVAVNEFDVFKDELKKYLTVLNKI